MKKITLLLALAVAWLLIPFTAIHAANVANPRCEYLKDPLGIDVAKPRLSWVMDGGERGQKQAAYQVLVASTPEQLAKDQGDLWDSGKVDSDQSIQVEYAGKPLASRTPCHWKVRVWDKDGKASKWSKPALWAMGLTKPEDWTAKWIKPGAPPEKGDSLDGCFWIWSPRDGDFHQTPPGSTCFCADLNVPADAKVKRASVVMSADNAFVLFVNGEEALKGNDWNKPQTAEITKLLKAGDNILAVLATNAGDAPSPAGLIGRVTVELVDGRQITLETGPAWKTQPSEQTGWREAGFDDASWATARVIAQHGDPQAWGVLAGQQPLQPQHPWLRRNVEVNSEVKSAKVYVNTPCLYELFVNGKKVGDDVLMPAYASIQKRAFYNVYDVSRLLQKGTNCIALWMGPGWYQHKNPYGSPIVRAQLEIETQEGPNVIATDGEWRTAESCITQLGSWHWNNFGGERYDAGKFIKDWNLASCEDRSWAKAIEITAPKLASSWQALPGNKMDPPISAKSITPFKGKWLIDFGTTLTGWMRLRVHGLQPGREITLDYADMLNPNLMFSKNEDGVQTHNQRDIYVAGSEPVGIFQSKFNQHGFRYVVVGGLEKSPDLSDAQAMMVRTHLEPAGEFRCSNALFNRIHEVTVQNTLAQSPTGVMGCGEPREKQGYGDGGSFLTGWIYNFRSDAFFMKWLQDWRDNQETDGFFGNVAPTTQRGEGGGPSWGGQASELMRRLILYYGDKTLARDFYPALKKYVEYLESHTDADILRFFNPFNPKESKKFEQWQFLGDWTPPGESADKHNFQFETMDQREFFNNCYRILLWQDLTDFAGVMGDAVEQKRCEDRLAVLRPLIHKTYFHAEKNSYRVNRQAYLVIALRARIMPEELRPVIFKQLEDDIVVTHKGHLDVGLQGSFMLLDLLTKENRSDLAALIMGQVTYPGWGFLVKERKVTTWPETWSGWGSQIIQVVGTPGAWFYEGLAGIRPDAAQPGFKHFTIRPGIVDSVDWVNCHHDSPYGRIVSNWKREGGKLTMDVTIPPNTTAKVFVPAKDAASVTESGKLAKEGEGVKFLRMENNAAVYAVGSGNYQFQSSLNEALK